VQPLAVAQTRTGWAVQERLAALAQNCSEELKASAMMKLVLFRLVGKKVYFYG